jgi:MFS family permease
MASTERHVAPPDTSGATPCPDRVSRAVAAMLAGTFTLRFATGLTGTALVYYLAALPRFGGPAVDPLAVGVLTAGFFLAELLLAPLFGVVSDRVGQRPIMQLGPLFGGLAVVLTGLTSYLPLLGATRLLEGSSTAASVPPILGYVARATAGDEPLRGRVVSRFELATLAGLGAGLIAAGPLYQALGRGTFFLNALLYALSFAIFRYGVVELPASSDGGQPAVRVADGEPGQAGWRRYRAVLAGSQAWVLAPTWIAVNAVLGLWSSQSIVQLVRHPGALFEPDQVLMGGFTPLQLSVGLAVGMGVFFAGLLYWGGRFRSYRRTTILAVGIAGGTLAVGFALLLNHSGG